MPTVLRDLTTAASRGSLKGGGARTLGATLSTSGATATTILSIPIPLNTCASISAQVVGFKSDYSAGFSGDLIAGVRRGSSGNVASLGSATARGIEDSAGTPAVSIAVDTTNQLAQVQVAGVAAETWVWEASVTYILG